MEVDVVQTCINWKSGMQECLNKKYITNEVHEFWTNRTSKQHSARTLQLIQYWTSSTTTVLLQYYCTEQIAESISRNVVLRAAFSSGQPLQAQVVTFQMCVNSAVSLLGNSYTILQAADEIFIEYQNHCCSCLLNNSSSAYLSFWLEQVSVRCDI